MPGPSAVISRTVASSGRVLGSRRPFLPRRRSDRHKYELENVKLRVLERRILRYHESDPNPETKADHHESKVIARSELRWMVDVARRRDGRSSAMEILSGMVDDYVVREKPLAYILGTIPFGPLDLAIRPPVLIPRPETEHWVCRLADLIRTSMCPRTSVSRARNSKLRVLDIGTGSGCIPLALSRLLSAPAPQPSTAVVHLDIVATDVNPQAIDLTLENISRTFSPSLSKPPSMKVLRADLFDRAFTGEVLAALPPPPDNCDPTGFDMLISNPPYITLEEYVTLDSSVNDWESPIALVGNRRGPDGDFLPHDGLDFYKAIARLIPVLSPGVSRMPADSQLPLVVLEIGASQAKDVQDILIAESKGMISRTEVWKDQYDRDRTVLGFRS